MVAMVTCPNIRNDVHIVIEKYLKSRRSCFDCSSLGTFRYMNLILCAMVFFCWREMAISGMEFKLGSLWPSDIIRHHRIWSTLVQVKACCLTATSNYLNKYQLLAGEVLWYLLVSDFTATASIHASILYSEFENRNYEITATSSRCQWVKKDVYSQSVLMWHCLL